jgi:hypothetical protein
MPGFRSQEIEADSAQEARRLFCDLIKDNLDVEHIDANNLETEDGEDPLPPEQKSAN